MSERPRASPLGVIGGLFGIATIVAVAGLWLRQYTHDRREVWLLNPSDQTAVVYLGDERRTLLAHEKMLATAPRAASFELGVQVGGVLASETVTRASDRQEVLLVDVEPGAAYVVLDVTPRFAANGTDEKRKLNADGVSFKPAPVQVAVPGRLVRLIGGAAATVGPLERLPEAVWLARKYGRKVHKVFRVRAPADVGRLRADVERLLAEQRSVVELECGLDDC